MAEVVGTIASAATLAGLFKVCIDVFDVICTYQNQEVELKKLVLRLNVEKCRLYVWGQAMGLSRPSRHSRPGPLDQCPFQDTVKESLNSILQLFSNAHKIKNKYGCKELTQSMQIENGRSSTIKKFTAPFGNFKIRGATRGGQPRVVQKMQWVVHDQKKFRLLIQEAKELIDGLQDITKGLSSVAQQDDVIYSRVMNIRDVETLDMVAVVCEEDYPQIAYAASTRADSISMATTKRQNIADWTAGIESEESDDTSIANLEVLTVTELKYQISRLLRDRQEREAQTTKTNTSTTSETLGPPTMDQEIESQKQTISNLERERDFYFTKLRDIELLMDATIKEDPEKGKDEHGYVRTIQSILYSLEEGFEIPSDNEHDTNFADKQSTPMSTPPPTPPH